MITPQSPIIFPSFDPGTLTNLFFPIFTVILILIATILVWSTTVLFLYYYFNRQNKLAKVRFWILITLPLIYFLSSIIMDFDLYIPQTDSEAFYYYALLSLNAIGCRNIICPRLQNSSKKHQAK